MKIDLKLKFPKLDEVFKARRQDILNLLAATMQTNRAQMFDKSGADQGKPAWAPLKFRDGKPLQKTGTLRKSFAPSNDGVRPGRNVGSVVRLMGEEVTIGTTLGYARMMNDGTAKLPGGVLRPTSAQALKFPVPAKMRNVPGVKRIDGDWFMFRKWVQIPARPMDVISAEDRNEFSETLANYIAAVLNEGVA